MSNSPKNGHLPIPVNNQQTNTGRSQPLGQRTMMLLSWETWRSSVGRATKVLGMKSFKNMDTYITLHYITLHYITLHYITLHYITLHYITIPYHTIPYHTIPYHTIPTYIHTYMHTYIYIYDMYVYDISCFTKISLYIHNKWHVYFVRDPKVDITHPKAEKTQGWRKWFGICLIWC